MRKTELIMGMPVTICIADNRPDAAAAIADTFAYFRTIDVRYSTYKPTSEISQINQGLPKEKWSAEIKHVLALCEQTKRETRGYFDIKRPDGTLDPSGLVKGWAIAHAAEQLQKRGFTNFYVDAGGDIQPHGTNERGKPWRFGIRSPFNRNQIVKTVAVHDEGIATSGTAIRGQHIYTPQQPDKPLDDIVSLTVIAPNIFEADRFATAAFAMGRSGIVFIEELDGLEGYMIDSKGIATITSGFKRYAK